MSNLEFIMQPRAGIGELVEACARGEIPFSGPDSLCSKVAAMGFKTASLHEMVCAAEAAMPRAESK